MGVGQQLERPCYGCVSGGWMHCITGLIGLISSSVIPTYVQQKVTGAFFWLQLSPIRCMVART